MPDELYERDILEWSRRQAERLRRVARGERVNDVDWEHVVEEIEDVGRSELAAVQSLLFQAMVHLLKVQEWPDADAAAHWRLEAGVFLKSAKRRFSPSMRRHIAAADLYADACALIRQARIDGRPPEPSPDVCPFTLDDLLADPLDLAALQARLDRPGDVASRAG